MTPDFSSGDVRRRYKSMVGSASGCVRPLFGSVSGTLRDLFDTCSTLVRDGFDHASSPLRRCFRCNRLHSEALRRSSEGIPKRPRRNPVEIPNNCQRIPVNTPRQAHLECNGGQSSAIRRSLVGFMFLGSLLTGFERVVIPGFDDFNALFGQRDGGI